MKDSTSSYTQGGLIALIIGIVIGIAIGWWIRDEKVVCPPPTETPPVYKVELPVPAKPDSVIAHVTRKLPIADSERKAYPDGTLVAERPIYPSDTINAATSESGDSAEVIIPITQRVYEDSTRYRAVVEGYDPRLISLEIYPQPTKPPNVKRWHIGPSVGFGWNGRNLAPFVGLTVTYSLYSF